MAPKSILFISLEHWDEIYRRNQFFVVRMAKDYNVYYVQPVLPFYKFRNRKKTIKSLPNIKLISVYKFFPDKFFITRKINELLYKVQLSIKVARKIDVLWINDQNKYFVHKKYSKSYLIYDITDDWTKMNFPKKELAFVKSADKFLCDIADHIVVCSKTLEETKNIYHNKVSLIKNGVDFDHYQCEKIIDLKINKPILMYTGSVHAERVDFDMVYYLANRFPNISFVFVGPLFISQQTRERTGNINNVHLIGAVDYYDIPAYMNSADILIVPHVVSEFTMSLDPIKQYEYLAAAKPVITTAVSGFLDFSDHFNVANNKMEFASYIDDYLVGKMNLNVDKTHLEAKKCSWDSRYNAVKEIIENGAVAKCQGGFMVS